MGCATGRDNRNEEEFLLSKWENELRFQDFSVLQGHYAITRFTLDNAINAYGFQQIATILELRVQNNHKNTAVEGFFQTFLQEDGTYNAHDLKVVNVLLSTGVALEKAPIIFEVFDTHFEGQVARDEIERMIKEAIYSSTTRILEAVPVRDRPKIEVYIKGLSEMESAAIPAMLQIACNDDTVVTRDQFVANLTKVEGAKLLSSAGIRRFLAQQGEKQP